MNKPELNKPDNLPMYDGWRPLEPNEAISKDARFVNLGAIKYGPDKAGEHGAHWDGLIIGEVWGAALPKDFWAYKHGEVGRIFPESKKYTEPLKLP